MEVQVINLLLCKYSLNLGPSTPPLRLRQKGTMSFLDSVHIKVHSTSYDDIELTPSNDGGVEMTVEASTKGKHNLMMSVTAIIRRAHTYWNSNAMP